jgi:enamine deaminase RidA (YjgF/YER057c/UK114 family)
MEEQDMPKEYFADAANAERSYSPAIKVTGGTTIYLAGVGATTDESGTSLAGDFDGQVRATFERIRATLARAGGTLDDIVTMTVFIKDMQYGTHFTQLRKEFFSQGFPCSALIGIDSLARAEMMVEVQAIAVTDG